MKYDTFLGQCFGLTFMMIVLSGILLSFSAKIAFVGLCTAFGMNALLYVACFYKALRKDEPVEQEIHP